MLILIGGCCGWIPAGAEETPKRGISLEVISWNIEWYPGKNRFARGPQMAEHAALVNRQFREM